MNPTPHRIAPQTRSNAWTHWVVRVCCLAVLIVSACVKKDEAHFAAAQAKAAAAPAMAEMAMSASLQKATAESTEPTSPRESASTGATAQRKIITTHQMGLEVQDFAKALAHLEQQAKALGGYVANASRYTNDQGVTSGQVQIRIPQAKADQFLQTVHGSGRIQSENRQTQDITDDYADLVARLNNAKASEARLLQMYNRAGKLNEVVELENAITARRSDIDAMLARQTNWDTLLALTTFDVSLTEPLRLKAIRTSAWEPLSNIGNDAMSGLAWVLYFMSITLIVASPVALVLALCIWIGVRYRRAKRQKRALAHTAIAAAPADGGTPTAPTTAPYKPSN